MIKSGIRLQKNLFLIPEMDIFEDRKSKNRNCSYFSHMGDPN